jgi:hypothetical protein
VSEPFDPTKPPLPTWADYEGAVLPAAPCLACAEKDAEIARLEGGVAAVSKALEDCDGLNNPDAIMRLKARATAAEQERDREHDELLIERGLTTVLRGDLERLRAKLAAAERREAELQDAAKRAAAELRHAFATIYKGQMDTGLVSRAVKLLEKATTPQPSTPSPAPSAEPVRLGYYHDTLVPRPERSEAGAQPTPPKSWRQVSCRCPAPKGQPCPLSNEECDDRQRAHYAQLIAAAAPGAQPEAGEPSARQGAEK